MLMNGAEITPYVYLHLPILDGQSWICSVSLCDPMSWLGWFSGIFSESLLIDLTVNIKSKDIKVGA